MIELGKSYASLQIGSSSVDNIYMSFNLDSLQ